MNGTRKKKGTRTPDPIDLDRIPIGHMPLHARVREQLREIVLRDFEDGAKFYSEPTLIEKLGISQGTIRRALTDLAREGLLVRKVPSGTFVRKTDTEAPEIRVIMPGCDSIFLMSVLEKILEHCKNRKLPVRIHHTHRGAHVPEALLQVGGPPTHQRVILLGEERKAARALYASLSKRGFRVVNIDTLAAGCGDAYIGVDNDRGIRLGMDHLMQLGHKRILLLVSEPMQAGNTRERVRQFRAIARQNRLKHAGVLVRDPASWQDAEAIETLRELYGTPNAPTAIFAVSDTGAWVALKSLAELGIAVPSQVSVLGFDDDRASAYMQPALSTLAQPINDIAQRALDLLTQKRAPKGMVLLPPKLVVRESTGRAK